MARARFSGRATRLAHLGRVVSSRRQELVHKRIGGKAQNSRLCTNGLAYGRIGGVGDASPIEGDGGGPLHMQVRSWDHQMFPAPGVYEALTTLLLMTVSACTTPLNFDIPAFDRHHPGGHLNLAGIDRHFGRAR